MKKTLNVKLEYLGFTGDYNWDNKTKEFQGVITDNGYPFSAKEEKDIEEAFRNAVDYLTTPKLEEGPVYGVGKPEPIRESIPTEELKEIPKDLASDIRYLRLQVDHIYNSCHLVNKSPEIVKAMDSLLIAKAWMGKMLQAIGEQNPYAESHNPQSPVIEKAADETTSNMLSVFESENVMTQTGRVKYLRSMISETGSIARIVISGKEGYNVEKKMKSFEAMFPYFALQHLQEAKMWLGWELGFIRKEIELKEQYPDGDVPCCPGPELLPLQ